MIFQVWILHVSSPSTEVGTQAGYYTWRTRRNQRKVQATPDWWVAALISKGTYIRGLLYRWLQEESILYLSTRILGVYIKSSTGFSHICQAGSLNNTLLSQGCILENGPHCGNGGQNTHSKDEGGGSDCLGPAPRLISDHILSMTSSNN